MEGLVDRLTNLFREAFEEADMKRTYGELIRAIAESDDSRREILT